MKCVINIECPSVSSTVHTKLSNGGVNKKFHNRCLEKDITYERPCIYIYYIYIYITYIYI